MSMKLISSTTLSATASAITFSNIPQIYTDLFIYTSLRTIEDSINSSYLSFNSSATSFGGIFLQGNGSTVSGGSEARVGGYVTHSFLRSSTFSNNRIYIPNYSGSSAKYYSVDMVQENNTTDSRHGIFAGRWDNTSAITSISIISSSSSLAAQSSAYLYGITRGTDGIVTVS